MVMKEVDGVRLVRRTVLYYSLCQSWELSRFHHRALPGLCGRKLSVYLTLRLTYSLTVSFISHINPQGHHHQQASKNRGPRIRALLPEDRLLPNFPSSLMVLPHGSVGTVSTFHRTIVEEITSGKRIRHLRIKLSTCT